MLAVCPTALTELECRREIPSLSASLSQGVTFNGLPLLVATCPISDREPPAAAFAAVRTSALSTGEHGRNPS